MNLESLRYPIGSFTTPGTFDPDQLRLFIATIEQFPTRLVKIVGPLTPEQQNWIYRPEGWTIKQVVHHCADSHMNAFIRFKLATTEEHPTVKAYEEAKWARQIDYEIPVMHSINIIEGLHYRWVAFLKNMSVNDFEKTYFHSEYQKVYDLYAVAALYAWHSSHHLAHIQQAVEHQGKFKTD
jgi:hypothetical protein